MQLRGQALRGALRNAREDGAAALPRCRRAAGRPRRVQPPVQAHHRHHCRGAPLFEKASIDEFYLDLTGMDKYVGCWKWSNELRQNHPGVGAAHFAWALSVNKLVSKVGTGEAKPNGARLVENGTERAFLSPLYVGKLPRVGQGNGPETEHDGRPAPSVPWRRYHPGCWKGSSASTAFPSGKRPTAGQLARRALPRPQRASLASALSRPTRLTSDFLESHHRAWTAASPSSCGSKKN
jgi:hypothetical protein